MKNLKPKKRLEQIIDEMGAFVLYKDMIVDSAIIAPNAISFKIPPANSDWVVELFAILSFMMDKYNVYVSGENTELNTILLVNTCTII